MPISVETITQIWDDKTGELIEIGPDKDGLDLLEIRYCSKDGNDRRGIVFTYEQAAFIINAIQKQLNEKKNATLAGAPSIIYRGADKA